MIAAEKGESGHGARGESREGWGLDDDNVDDARNWAVLLLYVPLMTVPFLAVAWLLS